MDVLLSLNHVSFINVLALAALREFGDVEHFRRLNVRFILFEFRLGMSFSYCPYSLGIRALAMST